MKGGSYSFMHSVISYCRIGVGGGQDRAATLEKLWGWGWDKQCIQLKALYAFDFFS